MILIIPKNCTFICFSSIVTPILSTSLVILKCLFLKVQIQIKCSKTSTRSNADKQLHILRHCYTDKKLPSFWIHWTEHPRITSCMGNSAKLCKIDYDYIFFFKKPSTCAPSNIKKCIYHSLLLCFSLLFNVKHEFISYCTVCPLIVLWTFVIFFLQHYSNPPSGHNLDLDL